MKKNIIKKVKQSHYFYSLILLLYGNFVFSQAITKQYVKEVNIPSGSTILVKGPGNIPFKSEGRLKVNTKNGYALEPRDNGGIASFIANGLDVKTSTSSLLKQIVEIKIISDEKHRDDATRLLEALNPKISIIGDQYEVDNNLNISSLEFSNGFFQGTKNIILLDDGSRYNIRSIEISAMIIIPADVTLTINSKFIDVAVESFDGTLNINADKSTIKLNDVNILNGRFNSCKVDFKKMDSANVVAYNSKISGITINHLEIGTEQLVSNEFLFGTKNSTSLSKYTIDAIEELNILETSNDEFKIREIGTIKAKSSFFSNYEIQTLKKALSITAKNGDVTIGSISKSASKIEIDNQVSNINIGVHELDDYIIHFPKLIYTEKTIPAAAKDISQKDLVAFKKGEIQNNGLISISCNKCKIAIKD